MVEQMVQEFLARGGRVKREPVGKRTINAYEADLHLSRRSTREDWSGRRVQTWKLPRLRFKPGLGASNAGAFVLGGWGYRTALPFAKP